MTPLPAMASHSDVAEDVLLDVRNLKVHFPIMRGALLQRRVGVVRAVDGLSFALCRGQTLGLVGESGCGKSTVARAILQLYRPTEGEVVFEGIDLTTIGGEALRGMRRRMQMIFQYSYASLDPRMTVGSIVAEPLEIHHLARGKQKQREVEELLRLVGLNPSFANRYPHEFSGGQRQRIGIARALAVKPAFVVADEPISALDVSIQAQIINLLEDLQDEFHLTYLFIAHDLSVVRHISDRVAVMYLGRIVELAGRDERYEHAAHPYTKALLSAVPVPDPQVERRRERVVLSGEVPTPVSPPSGCRFHTRCPIAIEQCGRVEPEWRNIGGGHWVACHHV